MFTKPFDCAQGDKLFLKIHTLLRIKKTLYVFVKQIKLF